MTTACGGPDGPSTCPLEAEPAATVVGGDANGDGHVDVSDGCYLARALVAGGPAPVCAAAVDLVPNGTAEIGDIPALFYAVGPKTSTYRPTVTEEDCPAVEREVSPPCGDGLALAVDAPAEVNGTGGSSTTFTADVTVTSPLVSVEGWSFTLTADGCTLDAGTTAGTLAADQADGTGGLRRDGAAWQEVTPTEAHVLTVLDWRTQAGITGTGKAIHRFTVGGTPTSGCATCTLTLTAGDAETGVESVVSAEGWRYEPSRGSATVRLCAD